jgi:hypothetical protein
MGVIEYGLGIDPGRKNLGLSVVKFDSDVGISLLHTVTIDPSKHGLHDTVQGIKLLLQKIIPCRGIDLTNVYIERFVSYGNTQTNNAEDITLIIGALVYMLKDSFHVDAKLVRAIEWKIDLVQKLHIQKGFDNPSSNLDKKFSIAAAHACLDMKGEFDNDHVADATCLASIGFFENCYTKLRSASKQV